MNASNLRADDLKLEFFKTATGEETAQFTNNEGKSYLLHSAVNPFKEARSLVETIDTEKNALYYVFGTGLGYHIKALKQKITPSSRIVILEPDEKLQGKLKKKSKEIYNDDKCIFLAGNYSSLIHQIDKLLHGEHLILSGNCRFLVLPAYARLFSEWVQTLQKQIISLVKNRLFELGNDVADTLQGIRQTMENLDEILNSPDIEKLKDIYFDKPAVIVSAGPSLAKNVELLREIKGRALILCVDASLNVLLNKNIIPDVVLSIERGIETYNKFYKDKKLPNEPVLVAPSVIFPQILKEYPGKKILLLRTREGISMWLEKVLKKGSIKMGTSVAHLAFGFAQLVGANPIIFVGQDLAYSPEGYSHGSGVAVNKKFDLDKVDVWVEGYNGEKLPSTRVWKNFLTWFESSISETDRLCIDATEGGAKIKGTEIMTLRNAIDKYCNNDNIKPFNEIIEEIEGIYAGDREVVLESFRDMISHFQDLAEKSKKALERLKRIREKSNFEGASRKKLIEILNKIREHEKIVKTITAHSISVMCFQTMLFLASKRLADMGDKVTPESVKTNINIQTWLFDRVYRVSEKVVEELREMLHDVEKKEPY